MSTKAGMANQARQRREELSLASGERQPEAGRGRGGADWEEARERHRSYDARPLAAALACIKRWPFKP
jgi:biotin-(acetyl-CoA carboxylase) ligase